MSFTVLRYAFIVWLGICSLVAPLYAQQVQANGACNLAIQKYSEERNRKAIYKERFIVPLVPLEEISKSAANVHDMMLAWTEGEGVRKALFKSAGIYEFYQEAPWVADHPRTVRLLKSYRDKFKTAEVLVGSVRDSMDFIKKAKKLRHYKRRAIAILEQDLLKKQIDLQRLITDNGWFDATQADAPLLSQLIKDIEKFEIPTQEDDATYIKKRIEAHLKEITDANLDMHDLANGEHKLRRLLRWLSIYQVIFRGKIAMVPDVVIPDRLKPFQDINDDSKKYLVFEQTVLPLKHVVEIKQSTNYALAYFVYHLGKVKDGAQFFDAMLDAQDRSGAFTNKQKSRSFLVQYFRTLGLPTSFFREAKKLDEQLQKSELLTKFFN